MKKTKEIPEIRKNRTAVAQAAVVPAEVMGAAEVVQAEAVQAEVMAGAAEAAPAALWAARAGGKRLVLSAMAVIRSI